MTVIAGNLVYDVADPTHPRLVCRGANTVIHLLDGNTIAYTTVAAGHVVINRRDLTTGTESRVTQLRVQAQPYYYARAGWTWDGSLEVYATSGVPHANGRWLVSVHLWSSGADHVLYTIDAGPGGLESRWAPRPILEFSPDRVYVAISDFDFAIYGSNVRVFSVADRRQKLATGASSSGGTWIAKDRFVWATMASSNTVLGRLMEWSPAGGTKLLRSDGWWFGAASSSDGRWLAGTLLSYTSGPRTMIFPVGTGRTFQRGLGSSPGFVTTTVVWYAEERLHAGSVDGSSPDAVIHALDVVNQTDKLVHFRVGEVPTTCCTPALSY